FSWGKAAAKAKIAGDAQSVIVGTVVTPKVELTRVHHDGAVSGVAVTFTAQTGLIRNGDASVSTMTVLTDANGEASVPWSVAEGANTLIVTAPTLDATPLTFTATGTPGGLRLYGVNANDDGLSWIDPNTGVSTFIGRLSSNTDQFVTPIAMATDPATGTIYVWNNTDQVPGTVTGISTGVLLTVNRCTGVATQVSTGPQLLSGGALAISPTTGNLYLLAGDLYRLDKTTGSVVEDLGEGLGGAFGADFDSDGVLYTLENSGPNLFKIDIATRVKTLVGTLDQTVGVIGSIAFTPSGGLIGSAFGSTLGNVLFDLNKNTGAVTNIRSISGTFAPQGMDFAPACSP
ncbi:MAG: hypothetical protein ACJ8AD_09950, partial [Gemmatimonadaceae bacterium]